MGVAVLIAGAIIVLVLVILCFVFIKKKILAVLAANLVIFLASALLVVLIIEDVNDMKINFPTKEKLFITVHENLVLGAYSTINQDQITFLSDKDLITIQEDLATNNFENLANKYYKIMIIRSGAIHGFGQIDSGEFKLNENEAFSILDSKTPLDTFIDIYLGKQTTTYDEKTIAQLKSQFQTQMGTDSAFKAKLFSMLFAQTIKDKGPIYLIQQYQSGNIVIYPETITFTVVKLIPPFVFQTVSDQLITNNQEQSKIIGDNQK